MAKIPHNLDEDTPASFKEPKPRITGVNSSHIKGLKGMTVGKTYPMTVHMKLSSLRQGDDGHGFYAPDRVNKKAAQKHFADFEIQKIVAGQGSSGAEGGAGADRTADPAAQPAPKAPATAKSVKTVKQGKEKIGEQKRIKELTAKFSGGR